MRKKEGSVRGRPTFIERGHCGCDQLDVRLGYETRSVASFGDEPTVIVGLGLDKDFIALSNGHLVFGRSFEIVENSGLARVDGCRRRSHCAFNRWNGGTAGGRFLNEGEWFHHQTRI